MEQKEQETHPFPITLGRFITLSSTYRRALALYTFSCRSFYPFLWRAFRIERRAMTQMSLVTTLYIPRNSSINVAGIPPRRSWFFRFFRSKNGPSRLTWLRFVGQDVSFIPLPRTDPIWYRHYVNWSVTSFNVVELTPKVFVTGLNWCRIMRKR